MSTWKDLRYAARMLCHEPGIGAVAILTVALGVGANTSIFSIVNGVLLRPLPYTDADRLVALREVIPAMAQTYPTLPVSARHFTEWRARTSSFERISAVAVGSAALTGAGEPEQLDIARVSADLFDTLGARPRLGRTFASGEDQSGRDSVAVITDSLWQRRFQADAGIVGKTIQLDSQAYTVIGVLPPWFKFPSARVLDIGQVASSKPEVFRPLVFEADELKELMGNFNYTVIARLKRGVPPGRALAELNVVAAQLVKMSGEKVELRASVIPMLDSIVGNSRRALFLLLAAVGMVLLIACVNLANLLLARAERRARDAAVRIALGASGGQLVRQALIETVLLALIGGVLGVALAAAGLGAFIRSAPVDIPRLDEVQLDPWVLLFALIITIGTGLLFGLAPAWRAARVDPQDALKAGGRTIGGGTAGTRLRAGLVTAEVGLSVVLLTTAALLMSSFARLISAEKGFRAPTVLAGEVQIPWAKYKEDDQRNAFHERVLDHLSTQPGVESAAIVTALPLTGETWVDAVSLPGDQRPFTEWPMVNVRFTSAGYFHTMGIPLLAGRTFSASDRRRHVAVISERVAQVLWPGGNAVGRHFVSNETNREVIGVVGDVLAEPHKPAVAIVYRPYWDWAPRQVELVARAAGDPRSIAGAMRAAVHGVDPDVPLPELHTMQEVLAESLAQRRFQMLLISTFAGTALLLAALGIYGMVSYSVTRRRNEMGVRMALGARAKDLYVMLIRQTMGPVIAGLVAGVVIALAGRRVLASLLYEVVPGDPRIIAAVTGVLLMVALAACFLPARRAARISPLEALRHE